MRKERERKGKGEGKRKKWGGLKESETKKELTGRGREKRKIMKD